MADNGTKTKATPANDMKPYSVTLVILLSEDEQIEAAKSKAVAIAGANPDKMKVTSKPSSTKDGLRVEFGVMR